ncbi:MAG: metalloprotease PmbA [Gammaproteobacteria bacterium]|nr:metalloprotease PmbA [Gammaproteobacteria bacterium]MDH3370103.1 metalloprotease PmbA [Gammaproteobacteria bacterium]MDH3406772.1 metalloprotease PmbA [Gammaproteobacteria bacterium]MDH3562377.1 metalloprotease PmbA [Gammaproteobacteria bacterium]MDH5487019.1 metalloprotease PmbA [Gammaproteobacteria bacterium]
MSTSVVASPAVADKTSRTRLIGVVEQVLAEAKKSGATAAEAGVNISQGLSVTVRLGEVETIEHTHDKGMGVTVYFGNRTGSASTTDFSDKALHETVRAACTIAKFTAEDDCSGLADPDRLAKDIPDLQLHHPWNPGTDKAIELAREAEAAARAMDKRINNSEGGSLSTHEGLDVYGNSNGFLGTVAGTRHSLSVSIIAQDESGMQRDYWYTVARDAKNLETPLSVGETAARRALWRLGGKKLSTRQCPVLYEAPLAASLLSHFISAVRGTSLYRQASFLLDSLGKPVFSDFVRIHEQPHLKGAQGSAAYDSEGVATQPRDLIRDGILQGYVLDSYSARKLKMQTTGNAGGVHNLTIDPGKEDLPALMKRMNTGLLVTELIGFGVNSITGDYSRGAAGFWVENGEIQYPVEEITIAGNLKDMFRQIVSVGSDVDTRGNIRSGSILIENMTVAGS